MEIMNPGLNAYAVNALSEKRMIARLSEIVSNGNGYTARQLDISVSERKRSVFRGHG